MRYKQPCREPCPFRVSQQSRRCTRDGKMFPYSTVMPEPFLFRGSVIRPAWPQLLPQAFLAALLRETAIAPAGPGKASGSQATRWIASSCGGTSFAESVGTSAVRAKPPDVRPPREYSVKSGRRIEAGADLLPNQLGSV